MPTAKLLYKSFMDVSTGVHGDYGTYFDHSIESC